MNGAWCHRLCLLGGVALLVACSSSETSTHGAGGAAGDAGVDAAGAAGSAGSDAAPPDAAAGAAGSAADAGEDDAASAPCPADMAPVDTFCIDRYEAPNVEGQLPLVMYTFDEADAWCAARGKRLCFDDEWTEVCGGVSGTAYPYGATQVPGTCNDDKVWITYNQTALNGWPWTLPASQIDRLADLLAAASAASTAGATAATEVQHLYQGTPSGAKADCTNSDGAFDMQGNVEEWTRRRDGGQPSFHGNLKGRYWAEPRTCQSNVTVHGDAFRFYEIGFRCCRDAAGGG